MKRTHRLSVLLVATVLSLGTAGLASGLLPDLAGHWAAPLVAALEARGWVSGDPQGQFRPEEPLTRIQWAKMVVSALQNEDEAALLAKYPSRFQDLPAWHWGRGYAEALAELGITRGVSDSSFGPDTPVSRAQLAVFLIRSAGLSELARLQRLEPTSFTDDVAIPEWARGEVNMAVKLGLFTGYEDGSYRPSQTITRAEGAVALLRLQEYRGAAYHLAGTLIRFRPETGEGVLRDAAGNERAFTMSPSAQYFRAGLRVTPTSIALLDQVWVVVGNAGRGLHLEARFRDLVGRDPVISSGALTVIGSNGELHRLFIQPGALIFLNGSASNQAAIAGATRAYLLLDIVTGEVRALDAVKPDLIGRLEGIDFPNRVLTIRVPTGQGRVSVTDRTVVELNGLRAQVTDLIPGMTVSIVANADQEALYLNAER